MPRATRLGGLAVEALAWICIALIVVTVVPVLWIQQLVMIDDDYIELMPWDDDG